MTGYGRGEGVLHDRAITVEVRAVNNRYLDCAVKIPRLYVFAEESIKAQVQKQVGRGKVDVLISIDATAADKVAVSPEPVCGRRILHRPDPDAGCL